MEEYVKGAEAVSLFCRIHMNAKRDLPIRASEMGMLILIAQSQEAQSPVQIAEFFKVTKPQVTAMVNSLVKEGYVSKSPSSTDRRSFTLQATQQGNLLVQEAICEYLKTIETLRNRMGTEQYNQLIELIELSNSILLKENQDGQSDGNRRVGQCGAVCGEGTVEP